MNELTDEQIAEIGSRVQPHEYSTAFARAILAADMALREQAQPVAWMHSKTGCVAVSPYDLSIADGDETAIPLYEAPPLSKDEIQELRDRAIGMLEKSFPVTQSERKPLAANCDDLVQVPRGLIGAACGAIRLKTDAPKLLAKLRRYTIGDLSDAAPAQPEPCHCDRENIGDPGVSCGDCPTRDYKQPERPVNCGSGHCSCIECVVAQEKCQWTEDAGEMWETTCGEAWEFPSGGPVENGVKFCHGCGKPVEIVEAT